ncbi:hypothetical protein PIB30_061828 [Stylosanthes scabra]|uniref:DUF4283 domain-containing protein n=1 Tax=Stylosanthes scabra TaxID=79078 RepID=A0ABU6QLB0_9FABA|nr:hypothetical protein [Stylosanthes scabra]
MNIWRKLEGLRIVELKPKIYQIFFNHEADLEKVLKKWDRGDETLEKDLDRGEIKVQMWNLPEHCKTSKLGQKIASTLGEVKECEVYENSRDPVRFLKATVNINTNKPILKGANIGSKED